MVFFWDVDEYVEPLKVFEKEMIPPPPNLDQNLGELREFHKIWNHVDIYFG